MDIIFHHVTVTSTPARVAGPPATSWTPLIPRPFGAGNYLILTLIPSIPTKFIMATNGMTFLNPPRVTKPPYTIHHPTRWEKEKAEAGDPDAFDYPEDPKVIGPWIIGETVGKGASGALHTSQI
jgi:hypothetical protein